MASAKLPTPDELKAVGRQLGMNLSDGDVGFFLETMGGSVAAYHAIEAMADPNERARKANDHVACAGGCLDSENQADVNLGRRLAQG